MGEAGRRAEPRLRALKSGRIYLTGQPIGHDCTVRSLNRLGAGVELSQPARLDREVDLYLITENVRVPANVAWQAGTRVGLKFDSPLDWLFARS